MAAGPARGLNLQANDGMRSDTRTSGQVDFHPRLCCPRHRRSGSRARVVLLPHHMEVDAVDEGVIVDRAGMRSAPTKGLKIGLSRTSEILVCDRRERQQLDLVDR